MFSAIIYIKLLSVLSSLCPGVKKRYVACWKTHRITYCKSRKKTLKLCGLLCQTILFLSMSKNVGMIFLDGAIRTSKTWRSEIEPLVDGKNKGAFSFGAVLVLATVQIKRLTLHTLAGHVHSKANSTESIKPRCNYDIKITGSHLHH